MLKLAFALVGLELFTETNLWLPKSLETAQRSHKVESHSLHRFVVIFFVPFKSSNNYIKIHRTDAKRWLLYERTLN